MHFEKTSKNVHVCTHVYASLSEPIQLLPMSDVHFDSKHCNRVLLKQHLDKALKEGRRVSIYGDWFDIMGTKRDPRSSTNEVRHDYLQSGRSYLDLVVEDSYEFLKGYLPILDFISYGNHETAIVRHQETDPLDRLIFLLNQAGGKTVAKGAYWGFQVIRTRYATSRKVRYLLAYHHGYGGNAPRSKGMLKSQLDNRRYPDANLIVSGHTHQKWHDPSNISYRVDIKGHLKRFYSDTLVLGTYKQKADDDLGMGWEDEKGFEPASVGTWEVDIFLQAESSVTGERLNHIEKGRKTPKAKKNLVHRNRIVELR